MIWLLSLASVVLVSAVSLVGLLILAFDRQRALRVTRPLVSLAVGTLLGDAFIHLLPEALARPGTMALTTSLLVLAGVLLFFVLEKLARQAHRPAPPAGDARTRGGPSCC